MGIAAFIIIMTILSGIIYLNISWGDEDPEHLSINDSWDPKKSRGRIKEKHYGR